MKNPVLSRILILFLSLVIFAQHLYLQKQRAALKLSRHQLPLVVGKNVSKVSGSIISRSTLSPEARAERELIVTVSPSCPTCNNLMPKFKALAKSFAKRYNAPAKMLCVCTPKEGQSFATKHNLEEFDVFVNVAYRTHVDFAMNLIPQIVLVDSNTNRIIFTSEGGAPWI